MRYIIASFLSLAPVAFSINARKDGGEYWQVAVKDQKMQEGVDCRTLDETSSFDVKPKYEEYFEQRDSTMALTHHVKFKDNKGSVREFEPRPNISAYTDDVKATNEEFEPRPNVSAYSDDVKATNEEFEPRPNISAYTDEDKAINEEFEPRPNVSAYNDDVVGAKAEKNHVKDVYVNKE